MQQKNVLYLNHAGTSWPKPESVARAVTSVSESPPDHWTEVFQNSLADVATFFHIPADRLVLTPGCTSALNLAIADQAWQEDDRVITSSFEHHALARNLSKLKPLGVQIVPIRPTAREVFDLEALSGELRKGKVKLVAITAACNVTGALLPYKEVIEMAHQYDAKVLLDGAQIAGWWDLDLIELGVDMFAFAGHKGPQSPWGIGGLYVAENCEMNCPNASCELNTGRSNTYQTKPGYCDAGSVDVIALAGLAAGCKHLANFDSRLSNARKLAENFADEIRGLSAAKIMHDFDCQAKMPTVAVSFEGANQVVADRLKANQVIVSSGFQCAPIAHQSLGTSEHGIIRFSFGPNQNNIDVDYVMKTISGIP